MWIALPILLFMLNTRGGRLGGFLVYTYLVSLIMSHWFGALVHASPWSDFHTSADTVLGFRYSTYGIVAAAAGTLLTDFLVPSPRPAEAIPRNAAQREFELRQCERLALRAFIPIGIASWMLTFTAAANLPSASAILSVGKQCLILGICLLCWASWFRGRKVRFYVVLALTALLPVATVVTSGFIGYGIIMVTMVLAFISAFYRPRWHILAGLALVLYGGVSLWVTYADFRKEVRASVWVEQDSLGGLKKIANVLEAFQFFDISNVHHLENIDARMNQNYLVGVAVRTTPSLVPFREGETIYEAVFAMIPRAIWPDKPVVAGSGDIVSRHTMIDFAEGTSVGAGQVFEFYVNFGLWGILVGFVALGALLRYLDIKLAASLLSYDILGVMTIFLVGSGLLQAGGSLSEVAASTAAGWVGSLALRRALRKNRSAQAATARHPAARPYYSTHPASRKKQ